MNDTDTVGCNSSDKISHRDRENSLASRQIVSIRELHTVEDGLQLASNKLLELIAHAGTLSRTAARILRDCLKERVGLGVSPDKQPSCPLDEGLLERLHKFASRFPIGIHSEACFVAPRPWLDLLLEDRTTITLTDQDLCLATCGLSGSFDGLAEVSVSDRLFVLTTIAGNQGGAVSCYSTSRRNWCRVFDVACDGVVFIPEFHATIGVGTCFTYAWRYAVLLVRIDGSDRSHEVLLASRDHPPSEITEPYRNYDFLNQNLIAAQSQSSAKTRKVPFVFQSPGELTWEPESHLLVIQIGTRFTTWNSADDFEGTLVVDVPGLLRFCRSQAT